MTDPLAPPPRRPAPESLRAEIARSVRQVPAPRRRVRLVLIPLAAAVTVAAVVLGLTLADRRGSVEPVQTASPYPTTASPTPRPGTPTPSANPSPAQVSTSLDVRPMTKQEIAADTTSCRRRVDPQDDTPRGTSVRVRYATVQRTATVAGPGATRTRVLLMEDSIGTWSCENGQSTQWSRGPLRSAELSSSTPAASVYYHGGFGMSCGGDRPESRTEGLFAVGDEVALGRTRIGRRADTGAWQISRPSRGLVHFQLVLDGAAASTKSMWLEFELLDRRGARVEVDRGEGAGNPQAAKTLRINFSNCLDLPRRRSPKPVERPADDAAGVRTCLAMAKESAAQWNKPFGSRWKSRLVISTADRWGAVLSDGDRLVGCSLFPTKEISPVTPDRATTAASAFFFALNPVPAAAGSSLWAAGRVPKDVSALSYRLPGRRDAAATVNADGYWMMMYHSDTELAAGNVDNWPPVVVSITRPTGTRTLTIPFREETMCRQVSHGC